MRYRKRGKFRDAIFSKFTEYHERKRARKIEASLAATSNNLPDYGSCAAARATNVKQTNDNDQLRTSELSSRQEVFDIDESKRKRTNLIDERHFHLMFQCDPSQLPDEQLTFSNTSSPERTQPDQQQPSYGIQQSDQSQMPSEYHPTTSPLQQFTHQQQPSTSHSQKANNQETINRYHPITVVVASGSFDSTLANDQPEPALSHINQMDYDNRNDLEDIPERPISRRGSYSRDDVLDTMIKPAPALLSELAAIETHQVQRSRTAHKFGHWSSSESDEEMQPEGYHKLSEPDDELDRDEKDVERAFNPSDIAKRSSSFGGSSAESESANDNRMHNEENFEERFEDDAEGEDGSVLAYKLLNESHFSIAKLSESQSESEPQSQPSQNTSTSSAFIV
ncbi:unnamed protein product [Anisakis simplex]|uniref:Uncharacterized protein n=1 Tax=Anisakis simplex TaxID=6269 RepID=A0A0M3K6C0_ANISI|nr:unnamed protein product [Anisakis simplex]